MVWLMNRARANPTQEGIWLATMDDPDVVYDRNYLHVDQEILQRDFAAIPPKPPAAFDSRLYQAARLHSQYLIDHDVQNHTGQIDRIDAEGFIWHSVSISAFSDAKSALHGHAAFNIDTGKTPTGMQDPPTHRNGIMSTWKRPYTNVGIAVLKDSDPETKVGPWVISANYAWACMVQPDQYNRFLVGTVWKDDNGNRMYDPGEGIGNITVMPDHGRYYAVSAASGGFAIPIEASGTYVVKFSGPFLSVEAIETAVVGDESVLLDLEVSQGRVRQTTSPLPPATQATSPPPR
jgi:hypothetical protein